MGYGTWLHGSIILLNFLSYGDDLNGSYCCHIYASSLHMNAGTCGDIYLQTFLLYQMVMWRHSASTYISVSASVYLVEHVMLMV